MELGDYIRILRKNWLVIVLITLVGIGAAAAYSLVATPKYEASNTLVVSTQAGDTVQDLQQGNTFTLARMNTYAQMVTTPVVMAPVITGLKLDVTPVQLAKTITATNPLNTTLITITATSPSARTAAATANALAVSLTKAVEAVETPQGATTSPVKLSVVQQAVPPVKPSSPKVPLNLALGLLIGLALGIAYAVTRSALDTRILTQKDVSEVTDTPIVGAIPFDPKADGQPLAVHADPLGQRAESFRSLRTNLQFLHMDGSASFTITSALPGEGKSTTVVNLAIALADAGKKVALLDTDLRKPKVADYLGIDGAVGLTDVLIGRVRVGDVMRPWGGRSLYVMPSGKIPPNPSELLGSEQMRTLMDVLERDFDVVLCDAPPLLPVTDAALLATEGSGAIVIVGAGQAHRQQLEAALQVLRTAGAKPAGIVISKAPTKGPDAYYSYSYTYGGNTGPETVPGPRRRRTTPTAHPLTTPAPTATDPFGTSGTSATPRVGGAGPAVAPRPDEAKLAGSRAGLPFVVRPTNPGGVQDGASSPAQPQSSLPPAPRATSAQ